MTAVPDSPGGVACRTTTGKNKTGRTDSFYCQCVRFYYQCDCLFQVAVRDSHQPQHAQPRGTRSLAQVREHRQQPSAILEKHSLNPHEPTSTPRPYARRHSLRQGSASLRNYASRLTDQSAGNTALANCRPKERAALSVSAPAPCFHSTGSATRSIFICSL